MACCIRPILGQAARELVRESLASGALVALVTATNSFVTGPVARELGIAHLIATIPAQENGQFTGKPRGTPSFREGKIVRVEAWLESLGLWWGSFDKTSFYSDSLNDLPLLAKVDHPVAVDPDDTLRAHALAQGWEIISL
jgi:HAD superfamily phosphoserine phosphatase-like hydrolase